MDGLPGAEMPEGPCGDETDAPPCLWSAPLSLLLCEKDWSSLRSSREAPLMSVGYGADDARGKVTRGWPATDRGCLEVTLTLTPETPAGAPISPWTSDQLLGLDTWPCQDCSRSWGRRERETHSPCGVSPRGTDGEAERKQVVFPHLEGSRAEDGGPCSVWGGVAATDRQ